MKEIHLTKSKIAKIDAEDYDSISKHKWHTHPLGYASTSIGGRKNQKSLLMHRLIMDAQKGDIVDHINGDKLDNRKSNLRICNQSNNIGNSRIRKDNTTGYKGVTRSAFVDGNYVSRIYYKGKHIHLGVFNNPHDAARMDSFWAFDMFGAFAGLSVIKVEVN